MKGTRLSERKIRRRDSLSRKASVKKVIFVIMASIRVFFSSKKGGCKIGIGCVFRHSEQAGGETKKPTNSVVVAKTLDVTQASEEVTPFNLKKKGRFPQVVVGIARNSLLRIVEKEDIQMRFRTSGSKVVQTLTIMAEYDARTDEALSRLASTLPTATALELFAKLDEAYAESHLSWQNVLSGSEPVMRDQSSLAPRHARGITPDDSDGDEEHPRTRKRTKIQGVITAYIDSGVREGLLQMHEGEGTWAARTRLAELGDPGVDHTWLWRLNFAMARPWMLMSTLARSASAWAVLGPRNPSLVPPATLAFWTRALRMPPAAPWARPRVVTTPSPLSYTQPHNNATTPLNTYIVPRTMTCPLK